MVESAGARGREQRGPASQPIRRIVFWLLGIALAIGATSLLVRAALTTSAAGDIASMLFEVASGLPPREQLARPEQMPPTPAAPSPVELPLGAVGRRLPALIVQVDDRPLGSTLFNASYTTMSAAINYLYARRHGYDYRYTHVVNDEVDKAEASGEPSKIAPKGNMAACFHPILGVQRSTPWCKILVSWLTAHETAYDYVLFLDSDA